MGERSYLFKRALLTLPIALVLWTATFLWRPFNFWAMMAVSVAILASLSLLMRGNFLAREGVRVRDVTVGIGAAVVLYAVFFVGNWLVRTVLPFAPPQISNIYDLRSLASPALITLLLVLVIGPGEEIYWRGLVQTALAKRWGERTGWLAAVAAYAGVHLVSLNPMVVVAALVGGLVWAGLYAYERRLLPVIISHVLWDVAVFVVIPLQS